MEKNKSENVFYNMSGSEEEGSKQNDKFNRIKNMLYGYDKRLSGITAEERIIYNEIINNILLHNPDILNDEIFSLDKVKDDNDDNNNENQIIRFITDSAYYIFIKNKSKIDRELKLMGVEDIFSNKNFPEKIADKILRIVGIRENLDRDSKLKKIADGLDSYIDSNVIIKEIRAFNYYKTKQDKLDSLDKKYEAIEGLANSKIKQSELKIEKSNNSLSSEEKSIEDKLIDINNKIKQINNEQPLTRKELKANKNRRKHLLKELNDIMKLKISKIEISEEKILKQKQKIELYKKELEEEVKKKIEESKNDVLNSAGGDIKFEKFDFKRLNEVIENDRKNNGKLKSAIRIFKDKNTKLINKVKRAYNIIKNGARVNDKIGWRYEASETNILTIAKYLKESGFETNKALTIATSILKNNCIDSSGRIPSIDLALMRAGMPLSSEEMKKMKKAIERINREKKLFREKESFFRTDLANFTNELQTMFNYDKTKEHYELNLSRFKSFDFHSSDAINKEIEILRRKAISLKFGRSKTNKIFNLLQEKLRNGQFVIHNKEKNELTLENKWQKKISDKAKAEEDVHAGYPLPH